MHYFIEVHSRTFLLNFFHYEYILKMQNSIISLIKIRLSLCISELFLLKYNELCYNIIFRNLIYCVIFTDISIIAIIKILYFWCLKIEKEKLKRFLDFRVSQSFSKIEKSFFLQWFSWKWETIYLQSFSSWRLEPIRRFCIITQIWVFQRADKTFRFSRNKFRFYPYFMIKIFQNTIIYTFPCTFINIIFPLNQQICSFNNI